MELTLLLLGKYEIMKAINKDNIAANTVMPILHPTARTPCSEVI